MDLTVWIGIPVIVLTLVSVLLCVVAMAIPNDTPRGKAQNYTLDQRWDHAPQLFSATEEQNVAVGGHHDHAASLEGGAASGKW